MLQVGRTIRRFRKQRGFSQKQLAGDAEMTASFLSLVESDKRVPSTVVLERLAKALSLPIEVILWDAVEVPENLSSKDKSICDQAKNIVHALFEQPYAMPSKIKSERSNRRKAG